MQYLMEPCTMLSGETAQGKYPIKSINEMVKIHNSSTRQNII